MTYQQNRWNSYTWDYSKSRAENLLAAEAQEAAVTQDKLENMERGIVDAHVRTNELDKTKVGINQLNSLRTELATEITNKAESHELEDHKSIRATDTTYGHIRLSDIPVPEKTISSRFEPNMNIGDEWHREL